MKRWARVLTMSLAVMVFLPGLASAEETMSGRIVLHYIKSETVEVGDLPGHVLGVAQQSGLVLHSTGEIAKKTAAFIFDLVRGKGTFSEYSVITAQDGSTLYSKGMGTATPVDGGKKFVIEGKIECRGGTGRYEGFQGTGIFRGERLGELKTGGDALYDFTLNCGKP